MATERRIVKRNEDGTISKYVFLIDGKPVPEGMKYCNACQTIKILSDFSAGGNSCKVCANARSRAYYAKAKLNKEWKDAKNQKALERNKNAKLKAISLMGGKCYDCQGVFPPSVYDFHHLDPSEKDRNPSHILSKQNWEEVEKELSKCVLLCSNCHRIRHFEGGE